MEYTRIEEFAKIRPADTTVADLHLARCLAAAAAGETSAYFELGVAYSTGSHGVAIDLIEVIRTIPERGAQVCAEATASSLDGFDRELRCLRKAWWQLRTIARR